MNIVIKIAVGTLLALTLLASVPSPMVSSELTYAGQTPRDQSVVGMSQPGALGENVSLFTGQHTEIIPLATLPTVGLLGDLSLSLIYTGNVLSQVKKDNIEAQASYVGLGFSMGTEQIIVDSRGTVDMNDDEYYYSGPSGESFRLIPSGNSVSYLPSSGAKWEISRSKTKDGNYTYVVGWTIVKDNGITYSFGDFCLPSVDRNATSYALHWGNSTNTGLLAGDRLYPISWQLKRVEYGGNFVKYNYISELQKLHVKSASDSTDNSYTRAQYLSELVTSNGYSANFIFGMRYDFVRAWHDVDYETFGSKRLDSVYIKFKGNILSRVGMSYDYLATAEGLLWKKLLLTKIRRSNGSGLSSLPALDFEYQTNVALPGWGAIKKITYPEGAAKEIVYKWAESDSILTHLNALSIDAPESDGINRTSISRNVAIWKNRADGPSPQYYHHFVAAWNGYWDIQRIDDIVSNWADSAQAAGDNWCVFYDHPRNRFIYLKWQDGRWLRDTIAATWHGGGSVSSVSIDAGNDFFVAIERGLDLTARQAHFYKRRQDGTWFHREVFYYNTYDPDANWAYRVPRVELGADLYAIQLLADPSGNTIRHHSKLYYGKYDYKTDDLVAGAAVNGSDWIDSLRFTVGQDLVAWGSGTRNMDVTIARFENGQFDSTNLPHHGADFFRQMLVDITPLRNGILYRLNHERRNLQGALYDHTTVLHALLFSGPDVDSTVWETEYFDSSFVVASGGNSFAYRGRVYPSGSASGDVTIFEWDGSGWSQHVALSGVGMNSSLAVKLSGETFAAWNSINSYVYGSARQRGGSWRPATILSTSLLQYSPFDGCSAGHIPELSAASGQIAGFGSIREIENGWCPEYPNRWIWTWDERTEVWQATDVDAYTDSENPVGVIPFAFGDRVMCTSREGKHAFFQSFGDEFLGKPNYPVVSKTVLYEQPDDPSTGKAVNYSYSGGVLDESGNTMRFSRAAVSTPYWIQGGQPDGWSISRFYNDLDNDRASVPYLQFPDLDDSEFWECTQYVGGNCVNYVYVSGYYQGGYLKDGLEYLSYDSAATDVAGACLDSSISAFLVQKYVANSEDYASQFSPMVLKSSGHSRVDGVPNDVEYLEYDDRGNLNVTRTNLHDGIRRYDESTYDFHNHPVETKSYLLNASGVKQELTRKYTLWRGPLHRAQEVIWPNADNPYWTQSSDPFSDSSAYVNSDGGLTGGKDIDTYSITLAVDSVLALHYWLALRTSELGEYCVIKNNGITIDSLASELCNSCQHPIYRAGSFSVKQGDVISIVLNNSIGWGEDEIIAPGSPWLVGSYCAATTQVEYMTVHSGGVPAIQTFASMQALSNQGLDAHGNLVSWQGPMGDTSGAKFSSDGAFQVATISNGFVNNAFIFDAEQGGFNSAGIAYDGWRNVGPVDIDSNLSSSERFTGLKSLKLSYNGSVRNYVRRRIVKDSLVRKEYLLGFWDKGPTPTTGSIIAYSGGDICAQTSATFTTSPSAWKQRQMFLSIASCTQVDSLVGTINFLATSGVPTAIYIDDIRFHPIDAMVSASVYEPTTGLLMAASGTLNIPIRYEYDSFLRHYKTYDYAWRPLVEKTYQYSRDVHGGVYSSSDPNSMRTTAFDNLTQRQIITFTDGVGHVLQTRGEADFGGAVKATVSGIRSVNAKGQTVRQYKPYVDLISPAGIQDYSLATNFHAEATTYYNGNNDVSCGSRPYTETTYELGLKARPTMVAPPGDSYAPATDKTIKYSYLLTTNASDSFDVRRVTDPDNVVTGARTHVRGKNESQVAYFMAANNAMDSLVTTSASDLMKQYDSSYIVAGAGSQPKLLSTSFRDDLGNIDSSWSFEYGWVWSKYDNDGQLRFSMNEKQKVSNSFSYIKYDALGRATEEGVLANAQYFTKANADIRTFPVAAQSPSVKYRWYFDKYISGATSIIAPGKLVRVENADLTFYKNFIVYPIGDSDLTIVKLPQQGGALKAIKHVYDRDGFLRQLVIRPNKDVASTWRTINYDRDRSGRVKAMTGSTINTRFADITYDVTGKVKTQQLGVDLEATNYNAVQKVDYSYDPQGRLIAINPAIGNIETIANHGDGAYVSGSPSAENDHYAMTLKYYDGTPATYANSRPSYVRHRNSMQVGGIVDHAFTLTYNELGWLTKATHVTSSSYNQSYIYNGLGVRTALVRWINGVPDTLQYVYDTNKWQFKGYSTTPTNQYCQYDILGNMTSDLSRSIYEQRYDYRNLLEYSRVAPSASGGAQDELTFSYDESHQRVMKKHSYQYWGTCGGGSEEMMGSMGGGPSMEESLSPDSAVIDSAEAMSMEGGQMSAAVGGGGTPCLLWGASETYYLYDGSVLLATFSVSDLVRDVYINGPTGRIATYRFNSNLHYFLNDNIGSTHVTMTATSSPYMSSFYQYYPFGEELESGISSLDTDFRFSSKQRDKNSTFDFYYFGERYYDPRIGQFTSVDKAAQFTTGYLYGANNPITLIDPDGNTVIPALFMLMKYYGYARTAYAAMQTLSTPNRPFLDNLIMAGMQTSWGLAMGKVQGSTGPVGAAAIQIGDNLAHGSKWSSGLVSMGISSGLGAFESWRQRTASLKGQSTMPGTDVVVFSIESNSLNQSSDSRESGDNPNLVEAQIRNINGDEIPATKWITLPLGFGTPSTGDKVSDERILTLDAGIQSDVANYIIDAKNSLGITLRVTDAYRTFAEQNALYDVGRLKGDTRDKVTNAKGGQSFHNYGLAFDVAPMSADYTETNYEGVSWKKLGKLGEKYGFEWGGRWMGDSRDRPHFQRTYGQTWQQLYEGQKR